MQDELDKERRITQHQIHVLIDNEKENNHKVKLLEKLVAKKKEKIKQVDERYQQLIVDFNNESRLKLRMGSKNLLQRLLKLFILCHAI